jgi:hypothetical protein
MKKKYIFFIFILTSCCLTAQVPGYMGKRFSIGYSNYFMLSLLRPSANAHNAGISLGINTTHCLNLEYAIQRRVNFCFSLQRGKTGMDPGGLNYSQKDIYNGSTYTYFYGGNPYKPMQIRSINIGFGAKVFQKGTLAPIGKYKKVELLWTVNHLTYNNTAFTAYNGSIAQTATIGSGDYVYNNIALAFTMGRSTVLFDKIVLDYGVRFGLFPSSDLRSLAPDILDFRPGNFRSSSSRYIYYEGYFRTDVNNRLFRSQLFNFHIGLSFLAF